MDAIYKDNSKRTPYIITPTFPYDPPLDSNQIMLQIKNHIKQKYIINENDLRSLSLMIIRWKRSIKESLAFPDKRSQTQKALRILQHLFTFVKEYQCYIQYPNHIITVFSNEVFEEIYQYPCIFNDVPPLISALSAWFVIEFFEAEPFNFPHFLYWLVQKWKTQMGLNPVYFQLLSLGYLRFFPSESILQLNSAMVNICSSNLLEIFQLFELEDTFFLICYFMNKSSHFTDVFRLYLTDIIDILLKDVTISSVLITDFILFLLDMSNLNIDELFQLLELFTKRVEITGISYYNCFLCYYYFDQDFMVNKIQLNENQKKEFEMISEQIIKMSSNFKELIFKVKKQFYSALFIEDIFANNDYIRIKSLDCIQNIIMSFIDDFDDLFDESESFPGLFQFYVLLKENTEKINSEILTRLDEFFYIPL